jgi:hypothetical protein
MIEPGCCGLLGEPAARYRIETMICDHPGLTRFLNAEFIHMGLPQGERLKRLNQIASRQMQTLIVASNLRQLEPPKDSKE